MLPLKIHEVPSGTRCFDWKVPDEWNVSEAWIRDESGKDIVNFKDNNLHLMGYSTPVSGHFAYRDLKKNLFSLPDHPDWIPYRTSYYHPRWGFCLTHKVLESLDPECNYEVRIDSSLEPGSMTYADLVLPGESEDEVLISTYICHPSMANNELSGPLVTAFLYRELAKNPSR